MNDRVDVRHGDSREVLKTLADNSVDSVVTDPPYALVSIVKRFGKPGSAPARDGDVYARASAGFMGKEWDTGDTAFAVEFWREVFRVLKPGGHVLAFGGTRTYHRLAIAIEDAGFEIRDQVGWLYASGFPKSHDVSKGIDKAAGAEREVVSAGNPVKRMIPGADQNKDGWEKNNGREFVPTVTAPATEAARQWQGWGTALKPAWEPIVVARKPLVGTVAENVLQHGTGALNIDGRRVPTDESLGGGRLTGATQVGEGWDRPWMNDPSRRQSDAAAMATKVEKAQSLGRWPANVIHDGSDEVIAAFPDVGQTSKPGAVVKRRSAKEAEGNSGSAYGAESRGAGEVMIAYGDSGSAARFFYSAKADADDRLGSKHPTVKPVDLMRYLCRLVTPRGGLVLDPFAGSGTTGVACVLEGFRALLIEREAEYVEDINARLETFAGDGRHSLTLKARRKTPKQKETMIAPLFGAESESPDAA